MNTFFHDSQKNTFLDVDYGQFDHLETPEILKQTIPYQITTNLPTIEFLRLDPTKKTLIYNYYNMDPFWHAGGDVQRVLLLEPSVFKKYPIQQHCLDFLLRLSENIDGIVIFVEEFSEIVKQMSPELIIFKEHPLNSHYQGQQEPRDWLSSVDGYYPSFFAFWKRCKKELME